MNTTTTTTPGAGAGASPPPPPAGAGAGGGGGGNVSPASTSGTTTPRMLAYHTSAHEPNLLNADERVASNLGFPIWELSKHEKIFLPSTEMWQRRETVNQYCDVRNHILSTWVENPRELLSRDRAHQNIKHEYSSLVDQAWTFLTVFGHINYAALNAAQTEERIDLDFDADYGTVVVIGAGLAGLAAATQLVKLGHRVVILEGRSRAGGRIQSERLRGTHKGEEITGMADLGGSVLYGGELNPLSALASQLNLRRHTMGTSSQDCLLYDSTGSLVNAADDSVAMTLFTQLDEGSQSLAQKMAKHSPSFAETLEFGNTFELLWKDLNLRENKLRDQLVRWHIANLEFAHAQEFSKLSLLHCEQDSSTSLQGVHTLVEGGNSQLVDELAKNLSILYNHRVVEVEYSESGVTVKVEKPGTAKDAQEVEIREFNAQAVVVTVPVGVLKRKAINFVPPLSARKQKAINELGFGVINKCILLFPYRFWPQDENEFGFLNPGDASERGCHYLFISYEHVGGAPVLVAISSGLAAKRPKGEKMREVKKKMMNRLRLIFDKKGIKIPEPLDCRVTDWGNDEYAYGTYTSLVVGSSGQSCDVLGEDIMNRVFFAGEATVKQYLATMHGAFISGLRTAGYIHLLQTTSKRGNFRCNACDSTEHCLEGLNHKLVKCFSDPHLEFGSFSVRYPREDSDYVDYALVLVKVPSGKTGDVGKTTACFMVEKKMVSSLVDVSGGNEGRGKYLVTYLKAKGFSPENDVGPFWSVEQSKLSDVVDDFTPLRPNRKRDRLTLKQ